MANVLSHEPAGKKMHRQATRRRNHAAACAIALLFAACAEQDDRVGVAASALLGPDETQPGTPCQNSFQLPNYGCARALDGQNADYGAVLVAHPYAPQNPAWIAIDLGEPKPVNRLRLSGWAGGFPARYPKNFSLLASNSGAFTGEEVVLLSRVNEAPWTATETRSYRFSNQTAYRHYRLSVSANHGNYWTELTEIALRFDPASDGLFDVDEDGTAESTLGVEPCSYNPAHSCFVLKSDVIPDKEIPIATTPISTQDVGLIGKHFGAPYSAAYVYFATGIHARAALYVLDLNTESVVAWMASPDAWTEPEEKYTVHNTYFDLVRGPDGRRYPFLAPGSRYLTTDPGWQFLCIFDASKIASPDPSCATGFKRYDAVFDNYMSLSGFRHNGGWVDDVDKDGWDDIHLPYLQYIVSISGSTGALLGLSSQPPHLPSHFDVAAQTEPASPDYFHSGRFYGSFAAFNSPGAAQRRLLVSAGNAVGTFDDFNCNVSRYMAVAHWGAEGFALDWSRYISFSKTIFLPGPWDIGHYSRWGEGINECVHRTSDSLFWAGSNPVVLYSHFTADPPAAGDGCAHDCQDKALCEQSSGFLNQSCGFDTCAKACWEPRAGFWTVQALNADNGGGVNAWPKAYLWGRVYHFTPNEPYALMIETFGGAGKLRFDQAGHSPEQFLFSKIQSDYHWHHFGAVNGLAPPKINVAPGAPFSTYYGAQPAAVGSSWGGLPELVTKDIDGDGLNDIQLTDGTWVGYHEGAIVHK